MIAMFQKECSQNIQTKPKSDIKMENAETKNSPKLEVSISADEKTLTLEYKVKNTTNKPIYLFNILWDMDKDGKAFRAKESVYSCLRDDQTLFLGKQIAKLPMIASVEFREIPYVTKLEAGKEFAEKIKIDIPVEEYSPYFLKATDAKTELKSSENVIFALQFISDVEGLKMSPTTIENAFTVSHPNLFTNVETLTSKSRELSVTVNRRTSDFERF